jgi:hypothetical protein
MSSSPSHVMKFPLVMAVFHVERDGLPQQPCKNYTSLVFVVSLQIIAFTDRDLHLLLVDPGGNWSLTTGTGMSHRPHLGSQFGYPGRAR